MSPILKKIPALTIGALSLCFIAAACGHGTEQRAASGADAAAGSRAGSATSAIGRSIAGAGGHTWCAG